MWVEYVTKACSIRVVLNECTQSSEKLGYKHIAHRKPNGFQGSKWASACALTRVIRHNHRPGRQPRLSCLEVVQVFPRLSIQKEEVDGSLDVGQFLDGVSPSDVYHAPQLGLPNEPAHGKRCVSSLLSRSEGSNARMWKCARIHECMDVCMCGYVCINV